MPCRTKRCLKAFIDASFSALRLGSRLYTTSGSGTVLRAQPPSFSGIVAETVPCDQFTSFGENPK